MSPQSLLPTSFFRFSPQMDFLCCPRDYSSPWQPSTPPAVITWVRYYMEKSFLMCSTLKIAHTVTLELDCSHKRKTEFEQASVPFKFISSFINSQNSALWLHRYYIYIYIFASMKLLFIINLALILHVAEYQCWERKVALVLAPISTKLCGDIQRTIPQP